MSKGNDARSFAIGWLAGAAVGCVLPTVLLLMLVLRRRSDPEFQPTDVLKMFFGMALIIVTPGLGAAAVGAALGLRRWWAAAGCFPAAVALTLACWTSDGAPGLKALVLLLPCAVVNGTFVAVAAGKVARERSAG